MTDAATRERVAVALATAQSSQWSLLGPSARESFMRQADAALSALQPPPKGWAVSDKAEEVYRHSHRESYLAGEGVINSRKAGLRKVTPHLLRDLADGVSEEQAEKSYFRAMDTTMPSGFVRSLIRVLADTLEGKA